MIYRNQMQIRSLANEISELDLRSLTCFESASCHIGYIELEPRDQPPYRAAGLARGRLRVRLTKIG